jgi:hypothetical protein
VLRKPFTILTLGATIDAAMGNEPTTTLETRAAA